MAKSPLFMDGAAEDISYSNVRDHMEKERRYCEDLWEVFEPYSDREFLIEIRKNFDARYWEMYLTAFLIREGYDVTAPKPGPDVGIRYRGCRIWFEATCPERGAHTNPDQVPEIKFAEPGEVPVMRDVPERQILLRYLNSISSKQRQHSSWLNGGIVAPEDSFVIAINPRRLRREFVDSDPPRILQAAYAVGPPYVAVDGHTGKPVEVGYQFRNTIKRSAGAEVTAGVFLLNEYAGVSALLRSRVDVANQPEIMGADFQLVENRRATAPLPDMFRLRGTFFRIDRSADGYVAVRETRS
jgi:hypothetical protein